MLSQRSAVLLGLCAGLASGAASASGQTLWANSVPVVYGWDYESSAVGSVSGDCALGGDTCRNRPDNPNCSATGRMGFPANWLDANMDDGPAIAPGSQISVVVDAYGSWTNSVTGSWRMRIRIPHTGEEIDSPVLTTSGGCGWLHHAATGAGWDVTNALGRPWTPADVVDLQLGIKRASSTAPAEALFVSGFRAVINVSCPPVVITSQPQSQTVCDGYGLVFAVRATGPQPLAYQWRFNGVDIPGATNPDFQVFEAHAPSQGTYSCHISSPCGTVQDSAGATLSVNQPPLITTEPEPKTACQGSGTAAFCVVAQSYEPPAYHWTRNGQPIGASTQCLQVPVSQLQNGDVFQVTVSNSCGATLSQPVGFTLLQPASIVESPQPVSIWPGDQATFSVEPGGSAPLHFQWRRNGSALSDGPSVGGGQISGSSAQTLTISNAGTPDSGNYSCIVSNDCTPSGVASNPAHLSVCYANCDRSTEQPLTNVNDFLCFLNKFSTSDPYANCDRSTAQPVFNVNDFVCFMGQFSLGCP